MNMTCGDNINSVHEPVHLEDSPDVVVAYCKRCKKRGYFRKDVGRVDPEYADFFKLDTLQPHQNLYYKYYGDMKIAQQGVE